MPDREGGDPRVGMRIVGLGGRGPGRPRENCGATRRRRRVGLAPVATFVGAVVSLALVSSSCGSSSSSSHRSTPSSAASSSKQSGSVSSSPSAPDSSAGTMTVTGAQHFTGSLNRGISCNPNAPSSPGASSAMLSYASAGPNQVQRELDVQAPVGTSLFPAPPQSQVSIRYSDYEEAGGGANSDYYDWSHPTAGTLTVDPGGKSGRIEVDIPYSGDEGHKHPANLYGPVHLTASWNCS